jgi:hypothetical protein
MENNPNQLLEETKEDNILRFLGKLYQKAEISSRQPDSSEPILEIHGTGRLESKTDGSSSCLTFPLHSTRRNGAKKGQRPGISLSPPNIAHAYRRFKRRRDVRCGDFSSLKAHGVV